MVYMGEALKNVLDWAHGHLNAIIRCGMSGLPGIRCPVGYWSRPGSLY